MSTLSLKPEAAARRRAAKAATPIVQPERTAAAPEPSCTPAQLGYKLAACWPHLFTEPVPLKIGIGKEIARHLAPEERKVLKAFMQNWVKAPAYLHACTQPGAHRVDLAGNLAPISEKHRAHAAKVLSNEYTPQPVEVGKP